MRPSATPSRRRRFLRRAALALLLVALPLLVVDAAADDRDLLRFNTGKPYVFILLDTSSSMTLSPAGEWLPANGDDPGSRIYQAKKALFDVFSNVPDIHVGFATYNQDDLRVRAKHWLFKVLPPATGQRFTIAGQEYPSTGELLTFGMHFDADPPDIPAPGVAGSCEEPLSFPADREKINRFAKLGVSGWDTTVIWLDDGAQTLRLVVMPPSDPTASPPPLRYRESVLDANFNLVAVPDCKKQPPLPGDIPDDADDVKTGITIGVSLTLVQDFLMRDIEPDSGSDEPSAGFWAYEDAVADTACSDGSPFSGQGWEGNFDSEPEDEFCSPPNSSQCRNLKFATSSSGIAPELDVGDMIPFNWSVDNLGTMLDRLAPDRASGNETFAAAPFFTDRPDGLGLRLVSEGQRPIVPSGSDSPLGKAIADFRCWYLGQGANKCKNFGAPQGFEELASTKDNEWGCRRPYLIVVGDGGASCKGENPCADTANLFAKAGLRSWVITFGGSDEPPLSCIASNGRGELAFVDDGSGLEAELRRVLGIIREEASAFASAAAPSAQRVVDRTVYVSTFTPINNRSRWDGHLDAFLKPLPLTIDDEPDRSAEQFQWDAGAELVKQAPDLATALGGDLDLGLGEEERRIFYAVERTSTGRVESGGWPSGRRGLFWTSDGTPAYIRYDLWEALQIPGWQQDDLSVPAGVSPVDQDAQDEANEILSRTVAEQNATVDGDPITYVLGDIFHSDPLVLGAPTNNRLFAENAGDNGDTCEGGNPSYRCFFRKHQFRRKQLLVGSNDGMLHAFDAGRARILENDPDDETDDELRFNEGTGREIWAYMPREVMPTVRRLAQGVSHRFAVDSPPVAADVFIDPVFPTTGPDPGEREFRTVVVTGLREGGSAYFALDITQPDTFDAATGLPQPQANTDWVPSCLAENNSLGPTPPSDCGPVAYPAPLWEFDDTVFDPVSGEYVALDENGDGASDLGDTWAPATIGRIQVCEGSECDPKALNNDVRDLWVAVFPGGMDPSFNGKFYDPRIGPPEPDPDDPEPVPFTLRGDWLYMVDIETGKTVYKRQLLVEIGGEERSAGPAPGAAAAVDTDLDGYLDRVYVGTTGGYLFRVDLDLESDGDVRQLTDVTVPSTLTDPDTGNPITFTVQRFPLTDSGTEVWKPQAIFSTNFDGSQSTADPAPIYHEPAVVFVAELGRYALAFGTGDREDLWSVTDQDGRFYVIVDETDRLLASALPQNESSFQRITVGQGEIGLDLLTTRPEGQRGWYLVLDEEERVITDAFSLAGVTFFSSYQPVVEVSEGRDPLCSKTGKSRIFIVNTTNANAFYEQDGVRSRFLIASSFVTQPYTEQAAAGGTSGGGGGGGTDPTPPTADDLTDALKRVMEEMKKLFPSECKFANYHIDIKTLKADTGVIFIAPVPVCLIERNWKEF